jgi:hypothetical protein
MQPPTAEVPALLASTAPTWCVALSGGQTIYRADDSSRGRTAR